MVGYNVVEPLAKKDSYKENDNIDFKLDFLHEKIKAGSLRISGDLDVYTTGTTRPVAADDVKWDSKAGVHSFFKNFSTDLKFKGRLPSFSNYPRLVRMKTECTMNKEDMFSSLGITELKQPEDQLTQWMAMAEGVAGNVDSISFYMKPLIPLNEMIGDLSYRKSGSVRISLQLNSNKNALYGRSVVAGTNYVIKNLLLWYETVPDDGKDEPVMVRVYHETPYTLSTTNAYISIEAPSFVDSVIGSFILSSEESQLNYNNNATQFLTGLSSVEFLINDQTQLLKFPLQSLPEMEMNYQMAVTGQSRHVSNSIQPYQRDANDGFGIGLWFARFINMKVNKLAINIKSSATADFSAYFFLQGELAL